MSLLLVVPKAGTKNPPSAEPRKPANDAAEDAGQVINPIIVEGQTAGAVAMGLSGALMECAAYAEDGQLLTGSLMDYALARAEDLPAFELFRMDRPSPLTPAGIKGMAEGGVLGAAGAHERGE